MFFLNKQIPDFRRILTIYILTPETKLRPILTLPDAYERTSFNTFLLNKRQVSIIVKKRMWIKMSCRCEYSSFIQGLNKAHRGHASRQS